MQKRFQGANWWQIVGIVVLAIVTLVIVIFAFAHANPVVPDSGTTPGYNAASFQGGGNPDPGTNEDSEGADIEDGDVEGEEDAEALAAPVPALSRILAMQDQAIGYRSLTGGCPDAGAVVEVTLDGGYNWAPADPSKLVALSSPLRLLTGNNGLVSLVAQNRDDCGAVSVMRSYTTASDWEPVYEGEDMVWYVDPANPTIVHVPDMGALDLPCEAMRLSTANPTTAGILCSDNRAATTTDAGASWIISDPMPGSEALALGGDQYLLARSNPAECEGTLVSRMALDHTVQVTACLEDISAPGNIALAANDNSLAWLWAGDSFMWSTNLGDTWNALD